MTALINRASAGRHPGTAVEISALSQLIRHADPRLCAPDTLPGLDPETPPALRQAIGVLRFRYEMLKELDDDHGDG